MNELGAVGRNLNQIARAMNHGGRACGPSRDELRAILKACAGIRDHVRELLAANMRSWESGHERTNGCLNRDPAWLDIVSYGRRVPGQRGRLGSSNYDAIARTTGGAPEVMVKVTGGGRNVQQVLDEIDYFGRAGQLEIETDDGQRLTGKGIPKQLVDDWDLEFEWLRGSSPYSGKPGMRDPKIVHNLMFSMPAGTPPQKVLQAVRKFAIEKFSLSHRYAVVLHTDQKHPHVHTLVKARCEQGIRLRITKDLLTEWRQAFARCSRDLGVPANATDRKSRGQTKTRKKDAIHRAHLRGESLSCGLKRNAWRPSY